MRVFAYLNLHQTRKYGQPWYSMQALDGDFKGRVVHRSGHVLLANAKGVVREGGRQRVLREGRKNVHAGMVGELVSLLDQDFVGRAVTYNPYIYDRFVWKHSEVPFPGADRVYLHEAGVRAA